MINTDRRWSQAERIFPANGSGSGTYIYDVFSGVSDNNG